MRAVDDDDFDDGILATDDGSWRIGGLCTDDGVATAVLRVVADVTVKATDCQVNRSRMHPKYTAFKATRGLIRSMVVDVGL